AASCCCCCCWAATTGLTSLILPGCRLLEGGLNLRLVLGSTGIRITTATRLSGYGDRYADESQQHVVSQPRPHTSAAFKINTTTCIPHRRRSFAFRRSPPPRDRTRGNDRTVSDLYVSPGFSINTCFVCFEKSLDYFVCQLIILNNLVPKVFDVYFLLRPCQPKA
ncbi:hypothetical protein KIL84_017248, partial [Mauremys mutica]